MNEKDKKLAHEVAWARAKDNCVNGLEDRIYAALTTVRKEAREAAFKDAIAAARAHQAAVRDRHYGVVTLVIEAIEAAANTAEGGGDG